MKRRRLCQTRVVNEDVAPRAAPNGHALLRKLPHIPVAPPPIVCQCAVDVCVLQCTSNSKRATGILDGDAAPLGVVGALRVLRHRQRGQVLAAVRHEHARGPSCVRRVHNIEARRRVSLRALHSIGDSWTRKKERGASRENTQAAGARGVMGRSFFLVFFFSFC